MYSQTTIKEIKSTHTTLSHSRLLAPARMAYLGAWREYVWVRMKRFDYWNPEHVMNNLPAKLYRGKTPGGNLKATAEVQRKADDAVYSIRYFPRDARRRDTEYYPDTPLTLTHNLMKGKPVRCACNRSPAFRYSHCGWPLARARARVDFSGASALPPSARWPRRRPNAPPTRRHVGD